MQVNFNFELIQKCQTNAPRYTSYPTADRFNSKFNLNSQLLQIKSVFRPEFNQAIALYIHIPFCNTLCLYCACNKVITNDRSKIQVYIEYLKKELQLYSSLIKRKLSVIQLHFGGGSPSWLSTVEISSIIECVRDYFDLNNLKECAMELDPRHVTNHFMATLKELGFNRVSLGVQDFNPKVQKAVNRVQSLEMTLQVLNKARELGFTSTNIDLIYGLPFQSQDSFSQTIDLVIDKLAPERIALFNYAHIPNSFMPQTRIKEEDLPSSMEKLAILQMAVTKLTQAGYCFIGMDHFARQQDELTKALMDGSLQRNFQGYSTFADTHMLSFGVSSIGFIGNSYYQNHKSLEEYYKSLDQAELPILRGFILDLDDLIRREIIQNIMCKFELNYSIIEAKYKIEFNSYFKLELQEINDLAALGLVVDVNDAGFKVSSPGRFLIRNIAKVFDKYLRLYQNKQTYSKVI